MLTSEQEKWISHLSDKNRIVIVPWDKTCSEKFEKTKNKIQAILGKNVKVFHSGASSLGISGQDEIDIHIPALPDHYDLYVSKLKNFFGEPRSSYPLRRTRFKIDEDGKKIDIIIVNKEHFDWTNEVKFSEYLKSHPVALEAYRILKEQGDGFSVKEYYRRKTEFINEILAPKLKVAVIGGGVMGLYISWKLGEAGHEVSLFDRKKEETLGKKCCSALVSERIRQFIPFDDSCIKNTITSCVINFLKGKVKLNFSPQHLALNREMLISTLLDLNKKVGTRIVLGQDIKKVPPGFDRVIGCDGALSAIRRSLGLPNPKIKYGIQAYSLIKNNSHITETSTDSEIFGFSWNIPKGDMIEYGALGSQEEVKKKADKIMEINEVEKDSFSAAAVPAPHFPLFNAGLIFPKEKNITLCGDAMGLTKPWSGGGIIWGLHAADILIKTFPDFNRYRKETVKFFKFKILKGQISNYLVQTVGKRFTNLLPKEMEYDNDFPSFSIAFKRKK